MAAATQTAESLLNRIAASTRGYRPAQGLLISAIRQSYADRTAAASTRTDAATSTDTTSALNPFASQSPAGESSATPAAAGTTAGISEAQISKAIATYRAAGVRLHADQVRALARWYCFERNQPADFATLATRPDLHAINVTDAVAREWMRGVVASYLRPAPAAAAAGDGASAGEADKSARRKANKAARAGREPRAILSTLASLQLLHTAHAADAAVLGTALYGLVYGAQADEARTAAKAVVEQLLADWPAHEKVLRGGSGAALTAAVAKRTVLDYSPLHAVLQDSTVDVPGLGAKQRSEMLATLSNAIARWSAVADSSASTEAQVGADATGVVIEPPTSWPDYLARAGSAA